MSGIIGILTLGVFATIVFQFVRNNSQGPKLTTAVFSGIGNIYSTLMK